MATTFKLFYLGTGPTIDTFEGNTISENHNALNGLSFGGPGSPIANNFSTLTPDGFWSYTGGATNTSYDADNFFSSEGFSIDGGSVRFFDTNMTYSATTITYTDGTSVQVDAIIMQDSAGRLYLLPPTSAGSYADALEAKPIQSVTLGTAAPSGGNGTYGMMADRYVLTAHDYLVEGSSGDDLINASYNADPDNDKIDATDNLAGNNNDSVLASGGNDTVYAGLGDDTVLGEAGDDILLGQDGNDTLDGGFGNDILAGGVGADYLVGSTGLDIADYSDSDAGVSVDISGNFIATGGDATGDTGTAIDGIFGSAFNDTLIGSDASGTILGDIYTTVIDGGAGNDSIDGRGGDDSLYGGIGADTILGGTGADLIYGDGISSMFTPSAHASSNAGAAKVFSFTNGTTSTLKIYSIDPAGQLIDYGLVAAGVTYAQPTFEGHNWVAYDTATNQPVMYLGSPADGASVTYADGDDSIEGGLGNDTIFAGGGNDTIVAGGDDDVVDGGVGDDYINGGAGNDSLIGGAGADTFFSIDGGQDTMSGGADADLFDIRTVDTMTIAGGETATSGSDLDTVSLAFSGTPVTLTYDTAESGSITGALGTISFSEIEQISLSDAADTVSFGTLSSGVMLNTGGGADYVVGTTSIGHNLIQSAGGNDTVVGGAGNDTISGGADDDVLNGGLGNDSLAGDGGNDLVDGGDGNDSIDGGSGNDWLSGGDGEDTILGGDGDDTLSGGAGSDILVGGGDQDVFFITSGPGSTVVQGGETGTDFDTLIVEYGSVVTYSGIDPEAGSIALASGGTVTFTEIERIAFAGVVEGTASGEVMNPGYLDAQSDQVDGSDGVDDTILGYGGDDTISAGAGDDLIFGGDGNDTVNGGIGADIIYGEAGNDSLLGGDDADILYGGAGDTIDGGEGGVDSDTLDLTGAVLPGGSLTVDYDGLNPEDGTVYFRDASGSIVDTLAFQNIEIVVPCFTAETRIKTPRGEVPAAEIKVGDLVLTRDSGMQMVRWVGKRRLTTSELRALPHLAPVIIEKGALGCELPERDMMLSPQHRVLMSSAKTQLYFGEDEVFVAAVNLLCMPGVRQSSAEDVVYVHIMFDRHEVICGDGAWSESFQPGDSSVRGFDGAQRAELAELFPQLKMFGGKRGYPAARPTLKEHEAQLLAG